MADFGEGYKYQRSVTAYLASLLSKDETVTDYRIFYEVQEFYPFDDIVLAVNYHNSEEFRLYAIQVKSGKITAEINKYLKGYNEIIKTKKWNFIKNIGRVNEKNIQFWYFACKRFRCQTTSFQEEGSDAIDIEIKERKCDNGESIIDKNVYKFCLKDEGMASNLQDFFNDFYIFQGQPNTYIITNKLKDMWKSNDAAQIIDYLDKYFTKNKKGSLTKTDFESELLKICLSDSIVTPTKTILFKRASALAWNDLTLSHNVTIVKNEADIETCLFGCILQSIAHKITIDQWNAFVDNEGRLSKEFKERYSTKLLKPETLKDLLINLWTCGETPLVLKNNNAISLLKEFSHLQQHYIIIDSDPSKRYDEMKSYNLRTIQHLGETGTDQLLQSILVSIQGRKPISLYAVINGNKKLMETFTCSDIIKLIEPRHLYLSINGMEANKYMLLIIETTSQKPTVPEDYEANGDSIFIYCHPDQSNEVYEKTRDDPKFKNYKIYQLRWEDNKLMLAKPKGLNQMELDIENTDATETCRQNKWHDSFSGLESFLIDQYGNRVYSISEDNTVPIVGNIKKMTCLKYLHRHMRKGIVVKKHENISDKGTNDSTIKFTGTIFPDKDFFNEMTGKICVITGEAGIGKTTLLKSLMRSCHPQHYILFCNLVRFQTDMRENSQKLFKDPISCLWSKQGPLSYNNFLNVLREDDKRLILILDSCDEVIPTCKQQVLKLIKQLNKETCIEKIIIGSRLLTVDLLSDQIEIQVARIEGFSNKYNGSKYIENWGFDEATLQKIPPEFATNPLYMDMLRIISQTSDIDFQTLSIWTLYERIIDSEINRYCRFIPHGVDDCEKENIFRFHWELAVKLIFGSNQVTQKFAQRKQIKFPNFARLGMIKHYDENEEPVFVHHTFAEFFAAQWLFETPDEEDAKYIYQMMLNNRQFDVLGIHYEEFALHKHVWEATGSDHTYFDRIENLCRRNREALLQTDGIGRTALHLAAIRYRGYNGKCLEIILRCMREEGLDLYIRDKLLNWTWIDYLDKNSWFDITEVFPHLSTIHKAYWSFHASQVKQLNASLLWETVDFEGVYHMVVNYSLLSIIDDLLFVRYFDNEDFIKFRNLCSYSEIATAELPKYFELTESNLKPLHVATIYSSIDMVTACIERGDNVNAVDAFTYTPLYYSVCREESEIVKLLLKNGANVELALDENVEFSAFQLSLLKKNRSITRMLIEKVNINKFGSICLDEAVLFGDMEVIEMLLKAKVDPNEKVFVNKDNHFSKEILSRNIVKAFKKFHDHDYDTRTMTADDLFIFIDVLDDLEKFQLEEYEAYHTRPLKRAIQARRKDIAEFLLKNSADANLETKYDDNISETESNEIDPLCWAVQKMSVDMVELLLQNGANVNYMDKDGLTPLMVVIEEISGDPFQEIWNGVITWKNFSGDVDDIIETLSCDYSYDIAFYITAFLNATDKVDWSLIKSTLFQRSLHVIEILIKHGADVNIKDNYNFTPLDVAITKQNWKMVEFLLQNGANPNYNTFNLTTILDVVPKQNIKIVELLLKNGADPNFKSAGDVTPLYVAARKRNPDMVSLLFEYGAHTNIITCTNTLLTKAKEGEEIGAAVWLSNLGDKHASIPTYNATYTDEVINLIHTVENQANVNVVNEIDITRDIKFTERLFVYGAELTNPMVISCINAVLELNNKEIDQLLLHNFMKHYSVETDQYTAVGYAAQQKNKAMIEILARNGQDVNSVSEEGRTTLVSVIQEKVDKSVVNFLLENQADVNLADKDGNTPLITAIKMKNIDIVETLLKNNATINHVSASGFTPLIAAIEAMNPVMIRILLNNGADANFVYEGGPAPLYLAILNGNAEIIKILVNCGANLEIETCGNTLLYNAVKSGYDEIVLALLSEVDLDRLNVPGHQPLVERIFRNRGNVDTVYEFGCTPLHLATKTGSHCTVLSLIDCNANPNIADTNGQTALHYAVEMNREDIVEELLENQADVNIKDNNALTSLDYAKISKNPNILEMLKDQIETSSHTSTVVIVKKRSCPCTCDII